MRLTLKEKVSYGLGAVGKDMVYMLSASYVLYYFQDVMGVSAIAMGIILLAARVFDAFNDPIMGVIVAKTQTRWGKFRPWLLIGTITNAIVLFIMFACPPSLDGKGIVAYAAITYILWGVTYTMMDIPYWSMVPAFTDSGKERENLSALARSCAGVGSAIITIITVMAVAAIGSSFASKNTDNITKTFDSGSVDIRSYVVMVDADGNPTSDVTELSDADISVSVTGIEKVFADTISLDSDNTSQKLTVNGTETSVNKIEYAMDSVDSTEGALVIYADADTYASITANSDIDVQVDLSSTIEVERLGFKYFSAIIAVLFVVFTVITCVCIKEKSNVDMKAASVGDMFRSLISNDQAMTIVIAIVLINTATYITSNLLIYFFKYDLGGSNWQGNYTLFNTFAGGMQILAMMLIFPLLRKVFNTVKIFYISVASAVFGYVILLTLALSGVTNVYLFFFPGFFIMAAVGVLNVIVTIFLANTVDYGELKNGRRDESVIFSMQTFVVKLASGIAALVASICLQVFNIQESSEAVLDYAGLLDKVQSLQANVTETITNNSVIGLRAVMTVAPVFVLVIAVVVFKKHFILNDDKMKEITDTLKASKV